MSQDHIVIVTGGSTGLGLALLDSFNTSHDNQLLINIARRDCPIKAASERGNQLLNLRADMHDPASITQLQTELRALLQKHQPNKLSVIHNAGQVTPMGLCTQLTDINQIDQAFRLNISSVIALNAALLNALPQNIDARMLLISSGAGRGPVPGWAVYGATKAAMDYYAQVLNHEQPRLRCVSLAPGVIDTEMQGTIRGHSADKFPPIERFLQLHEQQQLQSPTETARSIVDYLLSDSFGSKVIDDIRQHL